MSELENLENVMRLQAAALELFTLERSGRPAAERTVLVQAIGAEIEERASELIEAVRELRGLNEPEPIVFRPVELAPPPAPAPNGGLSGAAVRDVMMRFRTGFTLSEIAAELEETPAKVRPYLKAMLAGGAIRETAKVNKKPVYEYLAPEPSGPMSRPTRRPPEKEPPAGLESRATGMPVRVAATDKVTRRGRSTPGVRHRVVMRDRNYAKQEAAREARAEAARNREAKKKQGRADRAAIAQSTAKTSLERHENGGKPARAKSKRKAS